MTPGGGDTIIVSAKSQKFRYVDGIAILQFYGYQSYITAFFEFQKYRYVGMSTGFLKEFLRVVYNRDHTSQHHFNDHNILMYY